MFEGLLRLFQPRPLWLVVRDLIDLFIVAYVIYRALLVLRGTRAMQMGIGLGIVFLIYWGAKNFGLVTLHNLLSSLLSSIILIVVVVFQNDIRRALIRMGGRAWFSGGREQQSRVIDEVVAAATELARHRMGAIIAFEQDANVLEFVKSEGIPLDSMVSRELLVSLFVPEGVNKLHDGAVLIRDLKIARAGVFFPMPETKILDASLGSRHRAALGITEETDAVVVVVSEERGTISFCFSGNIVSNLDAQSLRHALLGLFGRSTRKKRFARKVATVGGRATIPAPTPRPVAVTSGTQATPPSSPAPQSPGRTTGAHKLVTSTPMRPSIEPAEKLPTGRHPLIDLPPGTSAQATPTPRPATFVPTGGSAPLPSGESPSKAAASAGPATAATPPAKGGEGARAEGAQGAARADSRSGENT
jgi:uncharacterized protein (TIGR00159 family)